MYPWTKVFGQILTVRHSNYWTQIMTFPKNNCLLLRKEKKKNHVWSLESGDALRTSN